MKTLADLKRKLISMVGDPAKTVTVIIRKPDGSERHRAERAPIGKVQTKDFWIIRADGKRGFLSFEKASDWTYENGSAIHTQRDGSTTTVVFND